MSDIFFKTVFVNILHKAAIAGQNHLSVCQHMRHIHMQGFQNSRAVCNYQQGALLILLELFDSLGYGADCIDVQTGIGFIQNRQIRF